MRHAAIVALSLALMLMALSAGCGAGEENQPGETADAAEPSEAVPVPVADYLLVPVDTIGVELGDSNYVFGQIAGASYTPDGRIAILDMQGCYVGLFSGEGEFIQRVGRHGSGPGEFLLPSGMSFFPDGGLVVADAMAGRLSFFDSTLTYESELTGFFPSPPVGLTAVSEDAFVGMKPLFEQNEDGMFMGFEIARYEGEPEPATVYFSEMEPFDPTDLAGSFGESIALFAASSDGDVYVSPMSDSELRVTGYDSEGQVLLEIDRDVDRMRKTEEEIEEEKILVEERMIAGGMPPEMANWNPPAHRLSIAGLGVDAEDQLWVIRGSWRVPFCEVYDPASGDLLFTVGIDPAMEDAERLQLLVDENGFLAFDPNPEYYPRLYVMELQ